jgi:hypothetical protein
MIGPEVLDAMVAAGCTAEQIAAAVKASMAADGAAEEARLAKKRAGNLERQRRFRNARNAVSRVTECDTPSPLPPLSPSPHPNPKTPLNPPTPAAVSAPERDFESRCRGVFGMEPIVGAVDFTPITGLIAEGVVTEVDVLAGCRAAMADPTFRPTYWRQIVGWARRANQERLGKAPKQIGRREPHRSQERPDDDAWRMVMRRWHSDGVWHPAFGPPGGSDCPAHIKAEFERAA